MATLPNGNTVSRQEYETWERVISTNLKHSDSYESGSIASSTIGLIDKIVEETFGVVSQALGTVSISLSETSAVQGEQVTVDGSAEDSNGDPAKGFSYTVHADYSSGSEYKSKSGTVDSAGNFSETLKFEDEGDYDIYATISGTTGTIRSYSWESGTISSSTIGIVTQKVSEGWES